jgi:hypothetical protein
MAQLTQPQTSGFQVDDMPPAGTYCAVILDIIDLFGVQRPRFENPSEKETLDVTRFLFGYQGQDGRNYKIQTREMRISGNVKAKLYQLLTGLLGHPPKYGWDYCELRGRPAMITVMHQQGRRDPSKTYAAIASVAPIPHQLLGAVPPVAAFNYTRDPAMAGAQVQQQQQQPQQQQPPHPPAEAAAPHPAPAAAPQPPPPYQYPLHVPQGPPPPQSQPAAPAPQQQQTQPPTALWNPETDDPTEVPF